MAVTSHYISLENKIKAVYKVTVHLLLLLAIYFKFCEGKAWGEKPSNVLSSCVHEELFNVSCAFG